MSHPFAVLAAGALLVALLPGQNTPPTPAGETETAGADADAVEPVDEMLAKYRPTRGTVKVGTVAAVKLADEWLWLAGSAAQAFLVDIGNRRDPAVLGVAIPPDF